MTRRAATPDEKKEFVRALKEARPVSIQMILDAEKPKKRGKSPGISGLDGATQERLRRGMIEPQARLDLHGYTETTAHTALTRFVREAERRGHRLLLIVTGKGSAAREKGRGILHDLLPRWLREPVFAGRIAGLMHAHRSHGGAGAYYLYLRKGRKD